MCVYMYIFIYVYMYVCVCVCSDNIFQYYLAHWTRSVVVAAVDFCYLMLEEDAK